MSEVKILEPGAIFSDIEAQPPLMREEAKAGYLGQPVDWTLILANAHDVTSGKVRLLLRARPSNVQFIATSVEFANYPWLKTLHAGEPVQVRGRISKIDQLSIELDAADVTHVRR